MKRPAVYILASKRNGTLYTGVTGDLIGRMKIHQKRLAAGFAKQYGVNLLVYFEFHGTMEAAIEREKQIKKWNRIWKTELIEEDNPQWLDLLPALLEDGG